MLHSVKAARPELLCGGPSLRELSGGNRMAVGKLCSLAPVTSRLGISILRPVQALPLLS